MSTIFRAAAVDGPTMPAAGPLVRGFVWSPGIERGEPVAVETAVPEPTLATAETPDFVATRAETDVQTPTAVAPTVSSPVPPIQRQPEIPPAVPGIEVSAPAAETGVPSPDVPVQPSTSGSPVATSSAAQPTGERPETPTVSPPAAPKAAEGTVSTPSPVQRQPAAAATSSPAAPTSSSALGRIWQRLGGLVSRSQPSAEPPRPKPVSAAEMPAPAVSTTETAVSPSEADNLKPDVAAKPAAPAPVQEPEVASLPETQTAVQRQLAAEIQEGQGLEQPPAVSAAPAEQPGEAASAPEASQMPVVPQPEGITTGPTSPAAVPPTAAPSPAVAPVQRTPAAPTTPTAAVPTAPVSATSVPPAVVMPPASAAGSVTRQPGTFDQPPTGPVVQAAPSAGQTTRPAATPPLVVPAVPGGSLPTAVPPALRPAIPASQPAPPVITPPSTPRPAVAPPTAVQRQPESAPPPSEEDRNWWRLETIMRRHKEQQAAAEVAETTEGSTAAASAPQPSATTAPSIAPSFAKPPAAAKPAPGVVSRQPAAPPREAPMVAVARPRGGKVSETDTAVPIPPAARDPEPLASPALETEPDDRESAVEAAEETVLTGRSSEVTEAADETAVTAAPLEAVWPVQTVEPSVQRQETAPPTTPAAPPILSPVAPPVRPPTPQDAWVQDRLSAVPPGMPTDSSVPLLRPRRPRPGRAEQAETSVLAAPIQAKMADTAVAAKPLPASPVGQRQPEPAEPAGGMVLTEIGELPPDLWTLIGQPAPVVPTAQPPAADGGETVMAKRDGEGTTAVQPSAVLPLPETSRLAAPDLSEYIQREPAEEEAESSPRTTEAPLVEGGEEAAEKKEGQEVDINELARQVYAQIRGQLAIDKERERGRLMHNW